MKIKQKSKKNSKCSVAKNHKGELAWSNKLLLNNFHKIFKK